MELTRAISRPDGVRLTYDITLARLIVPDRAVILIHGLASNRSRWAEFVEQTSLAARWSLMRVDLRGHGQSPTRGKIGLERWCDDLVEILDHEHYSHAVIVGHSLGAQVALHFAARFPHRTRGVVLIDPVIRGALRGRAPWFARLSPLFSLGAKIARMLNAIGIRRRKIEPLDLRALDAKAREALRDAANKAAFVRHYSSPREDLKHFPIAHYLQSIAELFRKLPEEKRIQAPVLLLLSSGATFAEPVRTQEMIARWTEPTVVTIDAEHWPLTEKPAEIRAAIESWLDRLAGS